MFTIAGWFIFGFITILVAITAIFLFNNFKNSKHRFAIISISVILIIATFAIEYWYFNHTASGIRKITDQKSEFANGIERVINVYTANGDLMASYKGKIDIAETEGGYVKFDYNGKRYIYYNCFVETIANIE